MTKLEPAYAEHARTFHDGMKERLRKEIASFALYGVSSPPQRRSLHRGCFSVPCASSPKASDTSAAAISITAFSSRATMSSPRSPAPSTPWPTRSRSGMMSSGEKSSISRNARPDVGPGRRNRISRRQPRLYQAVRPPEGRGRGQGRTGVFRQRQPSRLRPSR